MQHKSVILKRRAARSLEVSKEDISGYTLVQFDGGSSKKLGTGGTLIWGQDGRLLMA
jgi:hypothetical protein